MKPWMHVSIIKVSDGWFVDSWLEEKLCLSDEDLIKYLKHLNKY